MNAPLEGIRVVELTHVWSGPLCGQILADLGAEVIRVENASHLDIHRRGGPYFDGKAGLNRSGTWNAQNRGKFGCTLNIKSDEGRSLLLDLVASSDIVIENFTPGTLERLDIGFGVLKSTNPEIILLSLSGFGQTGPYRDSMAYGPMMDAAIGISSATTYGDGIPRAVNGWAADVGGALYGAAAATRALLSEPRVSLHLDISQFEAGAIFMATSLLRDPRICNGSEPPNAWYAMIRTRNKEEWVAVIVQNVEDLDHLSSLTGERGFGKTIRKLLRENPGAVDDAISVALNRWAAPLDRSAVLAALKDARVCAAPVASVEDLLEDPQLELNKRWIDVKHAECGATRTYAPAIHVHGAPLNVRPAPLLGEHNNEVYGGMLGLTADEITALTRKGII